MAAERVLVVDLDGTLIRSDMLFESFWAAFARRWTAPVSALRGIFRGRAALKHALAVEGPVDAASLPYNKAVLDYIGAWRAEGGRTALVTASAQSQADSIAAHLGVFDEVHGSDATTNLKGRQKAGFLEARFGDQGFDYIGDAPADLPVWEKAHKAILVNASAPLRQRVDAFGRKVEHLPAPPPSSGQYLRIMRPHQWLKNLLVFLPLLAAHQFTAATIGQALLAALAFSLVASGVYALNDLLDLAADRKHPRKRNRPFASGAVPLSHGTWAALLLLVAGFASAVVLGGSFLLVMLVYLAVTTAYSVYFKRQIIIDICILAGLYALRIIAGGVATGIPLSVWMLAFALFFFFSLAAVKRQAELVDGVAAGRVTAQGRGYHVDDLPLVAGMAMASGYVAVLVMVLYVNSPDVLRLYARPEVLWGICVILFYWINRTVMLTHRGRMHDDPVVFAVTDRISQACFALILGFAIAAALP